MIWSVNNLKVLVPLACVAREVDAVWSLVRPKREGVGRVAVARVPILLFVSGPAALWPAGLPFPPNSESVALSTPDLFE
jgi:hypothetical protein